MIEPTQITVLQQPSHLRMLLDILQVVATVFLGGVALTQAQAAREQANTARNQATAAETQAKAAQVHLKRSLRPRLTPSRWNAEDAGGTLELQNVGQGGAFAIRWRFDRDQHWTEASELVSDGDHTRIHVLTALAGREIVVEYFSAEEEVFVTKIEPLTLTFNCIDPASEALIHKLRDQQQRR